MGWPHFDRSPCQQVLVSFTAIPFQTSSLEATFHLLCRNALRTSWKKQKKEKKGKQTQTNPKAPKAVLPVTSALPGTRERLGQVLPRCWGWAAQPPSDPTACSSSFLHLARQPVLGPISPSPWLCPHIWTVHIANLAKKCSLCGWVRFLGVARWTNLLQRETSPRGVQSRTFLQLQQPVSSAYTASHHFTLAPLGGMEEQLCSSCNQLCMTFFFFRTRRAEATFSWLCSS